MAVRFRPTGRRPAFPDETYVKPFRSPDHMKNSGNIPSVRLRHLQVLGMALPSGIEPLSPP